MTTPARILRLVGITGLIGWLGMVGWVVKTSRAQNGGQAPVPAVPALRPEPADKVETQGALPPPPIAPAETPKPAPPPAPSPSSAPAPPASPEKQLALPEPKHDEAVAPPAVQPEPPTTVKTRAAEPGVPPLPASEANPGAPSEDPELSAQTFAERNQKEAELHLKALTTEVENLRTRLNKLESGIKKWENLVNALKTAQQGPVTSTAVTAGAEEAGDLEPIRPGPPGGARAERRVKRSTTAGSGNGTAASASSAGVQLPADEAQPVGTTAAPLPAQVPVAPPAQAAAPNVMPQ